jgi:hypothetical protein
MSISTIQKKLISYEICGQRVYFLKSLLLFSKHSERANTVCMSPILLVFQSNMASQRIYKVYKILYVSLRTTEHSCSWSGLVVKEKSHQASRS